MPQSLPRPDDPETRRRAALSSGDVHQVLAAAGAWLREVDEEHHAEALEALEALAPGEVAAALTTVDPASCRGAMVEAFDGAFEVAFEEDEEERAAQAASVVELLGRRDDVESTLVAAFTVADRAAPPEATTLRAVASSIQQQLASVDDAVRGRTRMLSPINPERRERAAALAPEHRAAAWWWTDRAGEEHDGLVELLAGTPVEAGGRAAADAARAALPPRRDALGAVLRHIDHPRRDAAAVEPAVRFAEAEAARSEPAAIALRLTRELSVDALDVD